MRSPHIFELQLQGLRKLPALNPIDKVLNVHVTRSEHDVSYHWWVLYHTERTG